MIGLVEPVDVGDPNQQKVEFNDEDRGDPRRQGDGRRLRLCTFG